MILIAIAIILLCMSHLLTVALPIADKTHADDVIQHYY